MPRLVAIALFVLFTAAHARADLHGRLPATPGGTDYQAYYDDQLDVTWAANANLNGLATAPSQLAWVAAFEIDGVGGWRLPTANTIDCSDPGTPQAVCAAHEYGHLYYYGAGTTQGAGITAASPGPFSNILGGINFYWSSTQATPSSAYYDFSFNTGATGLDFGGCCALAAWPVRDGDVGGPPPPVPISGWVPGLVAAGSALLGAASLRRKRGS